MLFSTPSYAPPPRPSEPWAPARGIGAWRFPEWFVVQEAAGGGERERSRRLVHRKALDEKGRFEGRPVVPTRFVRACPRGHVDDLDWAGFVHDAGDDCRRQLWLDERGTTGDLADFVVRCECGKWRRLYEVAERDRKPLGACRGARPWLGRGTNEECGQPSRLLIRTASNAYFPQLVSVLSLPDPGAAVDGVVGELWDDLRIVEDASDLAVIKRKPKVAAALGPFGDEAVFHAIRERKSGTGSDRPVKQVELDALLGAPEGFGGDMAVGASKGFGSDTLIGAPEGFSDAMSAGTPEAFGGDAPIDQDFQARRLPDAAWRRSGRSDGITSVIQLHRLREVLALIGFTRFEAVTPDVHGEYETDVERAEIALDPRWYPAVENRGEGVFVQLRTDAVEEWLARPPVGRRLDDLCRGHRAWMESRRATRPFPGGPYVLLHTLSHLLIQSLAMRCGYPASAIRERIYAEPGPDGERFGLLLYTGTPDAEGTLGGLVRQARHFEDHLADALHTGALCSNDPLCAQHAPGASMERRWLHGAACHGCALIAETSCEMRNDYLDRALVVPVPGLEDAAFFRAPG